MAVCKCPSIPTLMVSTLVAVVLAMLVQGQSLSGILNILDSGFSIDTALPEFNRLVNRGGLQSMLWTAALGILGMLYGSIMEKTGLLEALLSKMDPLVKSTGGLVTAVVLTCTLLLMVLPLITRNTQEALRTVPDSYRTGALGMGSTKWHMIRTILLPSSMPGIVTGIILALGRIVGESAALLFTAGSDYKLPKFTGAFGDNLAKLAHKAMESGGTLTIELYLQMQKGQYDNAFGIGCVLIVIVLILNLLTKLAANKLRRE